MTNRLFPALGVAIALACFAVNSASAEVCPKISVLPDATRLTDFEGTAAAQYRATMGQEVLQCVVKDGVAHARLKFKVTANLLPNADADTRKVEYFVVILNGDQVLAKQVYSLEIPFSSAKRSVTVDEKINRVDIPLASGRTAGDYQILVGFQLTREQVEYNRQNSGH